MIETSEITQISTRLKSGKFRLIGIDGKEGSGKSTLASQLVKIFGFCHINLDLYLDKNRGGFVEHIRYDLLQAELKYLTKPIIIEGVCLLAVLQKLNRVHDMLIYVKRMDDKNTWDDESECDVHGDIEQFISNRKDWFLSIMKEKAKIKDEFFNPVNGNIPELNEEIIRYHFKFKPHLNADIIYKRLDR